MDDRSPVSAAPVVVAAFGGFVYGLDPATGGVFWEFEDGSAIPRLIVTDTHVFALGRKLACLTYPDGQLVWQVEVVGFAPSFILVGDKLFFGSTGEVSCHSAINGQQLWKNEFKGRGQGNVALGTPFNVMQLDNGR